MSELNEIFEIPKNDNEKEGNKNNQDDKNDNIAPKKKTR